MNIVDARIAGIPCQLKVTHFYQQAPCYNTWDSDADFYGYTEINYDVLDRKGYPAPWLEKKITPIDDDRLQDLIVAYMTQR
jgi:hypothetical protein